MTLTNGLYQINKNNRDQNRWKNRCDVPVLTSAHRIEKAVAGSTRWQSNPPSPAKNVHVPHICSNPSVHSPSWKSIFPHFCPNPAVNTTPPWKVVLPLVHYPHFCLNSPSGSTSVKIASRSLFNFENILLLMRLVVYI